MRSFVENMKIRHVVGQFKQYDEIDRTAAKNKLILYTFNVNGFEMTKFHRWYDAHQIELDAYYLNFDLRRQMLGVSFLTDRKQRHLAISHRTWSMNVQASRSVNEKLFGMFVRVTVCVGMISLKIT